MIDICNGKRGDAFVPASSLPLNAGGGEHRGEEEGEERAHMGARATMGAWELMGAHGSSLMEACWRLISCTRGRSGYRWYSH